MLKDECRYAIYPYKNIILILINIVGFRIKEDPYSIEGFIY